MKKLIFLFFPALLLLFSCKKEDVFSQIENTTKGKKWTLQIGSSPVEVYSQLIELGTEKNFSTVNITYRRPFSNPVDIKNHLAFYHAITLQTKSGVLERAAIGFAEDKVSSIETGGALPEETTRWPEDVSDEVAILIDDSIEKLYEKLLLIYQIPVCADYQIVLPDKTLKKPFDPDMANYDEWSFDFSEHIGGNKYGNSVVKLFFKNSKLIRVRHIYRENETVN